MATSEAFQRVKNETLQKSHSNFGKMFGSTNEGQKLQIKKNEQQGIMETKLPNQEIATF